MRLGSKNEAGLPRWVVWSECMLSLGIQIRKSSRPLCPLPVPASIHGSIHNPRKSIGTQVLNLYSCQWAEIRHGWDTGRTESTRIPSVRIMSRELGQFVYHDIAVVYGPGDVTHQKCKFAMQCNVSNNLSNAPSDFLSKHSRSSSELNITVTT